MFRLVQWRVVEQEAYGATYLQVGGFVVWLLPTVAVRDILQFSLISQTSGTPSAAVPYLILP
jgi:hypothetical protein